MRSEADIEDLYGRHKHIQLPLAATFLRHHGIVFSPHLIDGFFFIVVWFQTADYESLIKPLLDALAAIISCFVAF